MPTKVPRKTRLSLVATRSVRPSNALTAVIAGELEVDRSDDVDIVKARVSLGTGGTPVHESICK